MVIKIVSIPRHLIASSYRLLGYFDNMFAQWNAYPYQSNLFKQMMRVPALPTLVCDTCEVLNNIQSKHQFYSQIKFHICDFLYIHFLACNMIWGGIPKWHWSRRINVVSDVFGNNSHRPQTHQLQVSISANLSGQANNKSPDISYKLNTHWFRCFYPS